ncbi:MAG: hypothetical protein ABR985_11855 [Methanotrichaceae archaeon]|jgi:hypothetical protein
MAKIGKHNKNLSAMVALILLVSIGTGMVGVVIAKPYFNITQGMNLSQVLGRSDLNSSNLTNATTPQQPVHLVHGIYGDSDQYPEHPAHTIDGTVPNTTLQQANWMGSDSGLPSSGSQVSLSPGSQAQWANDILQELGLGSQGTHPPSQSPGSQGSQLPAFLQ